MESLLVRFGAAAVSASNFSLGVVLFGRLVEAAVGLFGPLDDFDPYLLEWHRRVEARRAVRDRHDLARPDHGGPPATWRRAISRSSQSVPAQSPGMHLVGFDAAGETIELRLTARDRSAYAAGILAAADWLPRPARAGPPRPDPVVDELIARHPIAA